MKTTIVSLILTACLFLSLPKIYAQEEIDNKIKDKSEERIDQRTNEGIDKGLDAVENGVKGLFKKKDKTRDNQDNGNSENTESNQEQSDKPADKPEQKQVSKQEPKLESYTKYDFVPGDKVILFEDFSQDAIGDFPALWTTNGSGEVRTLNNYPGNWLFMNAKDKMYCLMKDLTLPENFIVEFDVVPTEFEDNQGHSAFCLSFYNSTGEFMDDGLVPGSQGFHLTFGTENVDVSGYNNQEYGLSGSSELAPMELNKVNHLIVWVQKRRLRIYHKGQKVLDMPTLLPDQIKVNRLRYSLWGLQGFPYITNLRITTASPDLRSKLLTEGKLVSYGLYFDVNSDKLKPESNGTLKGIAQVLNENPSVRIKVIGHTDGDGDAAKNLDLSKRRAASVKNEMVKSFGIDASRIETDGKGKTEPLAPNDTPANKAQNRRVEFIKL